MKTKETYVDGFVLVIQKEKLKEYKKMATRGRDVWKKYGAVDYKECVLEDSTPDQITFTFGKMMKLKENETVIFAYITYPSKAERNKINKLVMSDPMMHDPKYKDMPMPWDMKRFAYAGFKILVS